MNSLVVVYGLDEPIIPQTIYSGIKFELFHFARLGSLYINKIIIIIFKLTFHVPRLWLSVGCYTEVDI